MQFKRLYFLVYTLDFQTPCEEVWLNPKNMPSQTPQEVWLEDYGYILLFYILTNVLHKNHEILSPPPRRLLSHPSPDIFRLLL